MGMRYFQENGRFFQKSQKHFFAKKQSHSLRISSDEIP